MLKKSLFCLVLIGLMASLGVAADQYSKPAPAAGAKSMSATLTVRLVDEQIKAKDKMADVEVIVKGATLGMTNKAAHLHYQIDNGPYIVTAMKNLSFANLTSGEHNISVTVVDHMHNPISDTQTVKVTIP